MILKDQIKRYEAINGQEAFNLLIDHILGKDWTVVDPMNQDQVNVVALNEIVAKYDNLKRTPWNRFLNWLKSK